MQGLRGTQGLPGGSPHSRVPEAEGNRVPPTPAPQPLPGAAVIGFLLHKPLRAVGPGDWTDVEGRAERDAARMRPLLDSLEGDGEGQRGKRCAGSRRVWRGRVAVLGALWGLLKTRSVLGLSQNSSCPSIISSSD